MSASRYLYRGLSRIVHHFEKAQVPLRGVVGQPWAAPTPDNISYLQSVFRTSDVSQTQNIDDGMRALRQLQSQLAVLWEAQQPTRRAMSMWAQADRRAWDMPPDQRWTYMLYLGARMLKPLGMGEVADVQEDSLLGNGATGVKCIQQLEALTAAVQQSAPAGLFPSEAQPSADGAETREDQLKHISAVLFEQHRFRQMPFEWVYDGLSPVLLADVLESRKGLSVMLAIVYVLVARDVGLTLTMAPVPKVAVPSLAGTGVHRVSTVASAPMPADWMVYSPGSPTLQVDPLDKGKVSVVAPENPVHQAKPAFHMAVWAELARIMMTAHQRRGESDDVAHWMYQLMALDPTASEWQIFEQSFEPRQ